MKLLRFDKTDGPVQTLRDIRELLYLLVVQADVERNRGEWPALRRFQEERMDRVESE